MIFVSGTTNMQKHLWLINNQILACFAKKIRTSTFNGLSTPKFQVVYIQIYVLLSSESSKVRPGYESSYPERTLEGTKGK